MTEKMSQVIELEGVTMYAGARYDMGLSNVSLSLERGDAAVLMISNAGLSAPLFDLCCGMENPDAGSVRFFGQSWADRTPVQISRDRGRIGHIRADSAWVGNLDIDENILLPHLHHTHRSVFKIREEAKTMAKSFGLDDLPQTRPAWTPEIIRRKAQWVRALMSSPALLLLELPDDNCDDEDRVRFVAAVEQARTRGTAVLWITASQNPVLPALSGTVSRAEFIDTELIWHSEKTGMLHTSKG